VSTAKKTPVTEDVRIASSCEMCLVSCPIVVRRVNGVVVKVEGQPASEKFQGMLCAKGASAPMLIDDPDRVNYPLLRTNPEKGAGVDPKWKRISWDEALGIAAEKLAKTIKEDPRKVLFYEAAICFYSYVHTAASFLGTIGGGTLVAAASVMCGNAEHFLAVARQTLFDAVDWQHTNYVMQFGVMTGGGGSLAPGFVNRRHADARVRGIKFVNVDPVGSPTTEIADEWVPIRPGSDGAMLMAMMHVIIHEMRTVDAEYLTADTNMAYLIKQDGHYVRNGDGKPMMYDAVDQAAKPFDAQFKEIALEGKYTVDGVPCRTAYEALKEEVRGWTPEKAEAITTVPATDIRRLTRELVDSAQIGATIEIDGKVLRYRPAALTAGRGLCCHDNTMDTWMAFLMVGELLGLPGAVGGLAHPGSVSKGYEPGDYSWGLSPGKDGLHEGWWYLGQFRFPFSGYPVPDPKPPSTLGMGELTPTVMLSSRVPYAILEPKRFALDINTDGCFLITTGGNFAYNIGQKVFEEAYKKCFTVSFQTYLNDSVNALADIVLPGTSHLERTSCPQPFSHTYQQPGYPGKWELFIRQPVVPPRYERRDENDVMIALLDRLGLRGTYNAVMSAIMALKEPWTLKPDEKYAWPDMVDRYCRSHFGEDKGLEWFKANGMLSWSSKLEEWYWPQFKQAGRAVVYHGHLLEHYDKLEKIIKEKKIDHPLGGWHALPHWEPCAQLRESNAEYDMAAVFYKHPLTSQTYGRYNVVLDEALNKDVAADYALINTQTALRKGIADGDTIVIEAPDGGQMTVKARHTEVVHTNVIGICNGLANESPHLHRNKGQNFTNRLLRIDWDFTDKKVHATEGDRAVRVRKA
jgi:anaerobic selenocysteine-containing dehydrogenase